MPLGENINAIDDLAEAILRCNSRLTVAALGGNAGAGGCFLARRRMSSARWRDA